MTTKPPVISNARFIKGIQCHKALWLTIHRPELKPKVLEQQKTLFDSGNEVGRWAQKLFPGGIEVPSEGLGLSDQVALTKKLIKDGTKTIYGAAFSYRNIFVKADILHSTKPGWALVGAESLSIHDEVSLNDLAVQYHVISGNGLKLTEGIRLSVDCRYVRHGEIEPEKLFESEDLTEDILNAQKDIIEELERQRVILSKPEPVIDIGTYCHYPYDCVFVSHCHAHIPENGSVFELAGLGDEACYALYNQGYLKMEDVPLSKLGPEQRQQVECLNRPEPVVDPAALKIFLAGLTWPLAFLDYGVGCLTPIPMFDRTGPFQHVPLQFSLHVQGEPDGELRHLEFLSDDCSDPQPAFIEALLRAAPAEGNVIVWDKTYMHTPLYYLARAYPEFSEALMSLKKLLVPMCWPFHRREFYQGCMNGSSSLDSVVSALAPECSYEGLDIQNWDVATSAWSEMIQTTDPARKAHLRDSLLRFGQQGTLRLVKILEKVREASRR